jgi:hypothetical protein
MSSVGAPRLCIVCGEAPAGRRPSRIPRDER